LGSPDGGAVEGGEGGVEKRGEQEKDDPRQAMSWSRVPRHSPEEEDEWSDKESDEEREVVERVGDDGRHVLRDTEVVGEEETYGTADIDHKWLDFLECDGKVFCEIWQYLNMEDDR
jgi:hypothetical protein